MKDITLKIRKGVFETNSSSTHSICIAKEVELDIPSSLHLEFGEFGWGWETLDSDESKASYLYTGLFSNGMHEGIKKVIDTLTDRGIQVTVEEPVYENGRDYASNSGYVDHAAEMADFIAAVLEDESKLMNYLFSPLSFIRTGNDNEEGDTDIAVSYAHDAYYKSN